MEVIFKRWNFENMESIETKPTFATYTNLINLMNKFLIIKYPAYM